MSAKLNVDRVRYSNERQLQETWQSVSWWRLGLAVTVLCTSVKLPYIRPG